MRTSRRPRRELQGRDRDSKQRAHDALTELSAYVLALDMECHRLDAHVSELARVDASPAERRAILDERDEIAEELTALRGVIGALREELTERAAT